MNQTYQGSASHQGPVPHPLPSISRTCAFHPERGGIGVCISCRQVFCRECVTRINDKNLCQACLVEQRPALEKKAGGSPIVKPTRTSMAGRFGAYLLSLVVLGVIGALFFVLSLYPAFFHSMYNRF